MKLAERIRDLDVHLPGEDADFTIHASAKMFKILSDQMYSDKPGAILRELGANAVDSHRAAGKADKPFEVQLPTALDPILRIRDFGTGMSEEFIKRRYNSYGVSTKNDNNDDIGGLGLGSKTPLAYTDSFQITSWYEGEKKVYIAYIKANGSPSVNGPISTEPCGDETGVEITLPIHAQDFGRFRDAAAKTYMWFDPMPRINTPITMVDWTVRNETFGILSSYYLSQLRILMGPVAYPVDQYQLTQALQQLPEKDRDKINGLFYTRGLCLFAPIGSVDITPSREALSYDSGSIDKLVQLLRDTANQILSEVERTLEDCNTFTEAKLLFHRLANESRVNYELIKNAEWQGQRLEDEIKIRGPLTWDVISERDFRLKSRMVLNWHYGAFRFNDTVAFNYKAPTFYVRDDDKIKVSSLLKHNEATLKPLTPFVLLDSPTQADLNQIQIAFDGLATIRKLSELPTPPKATRTAVPKIPGATPRTRRPTKLANLMTHTADNPYGFTQDIPLKTPLDRHCFITQIKGGALRTGPSDNIQVDTDLLKLLLADDTLLGQWTVVVVPSHHVKTGRELQAPSLYDVAKQKLTALTGTYRDIARRTSWENFRDNYNNHSVFRFLLNLLHDGQWNDTLHSPLKAKAPGHPLLQMYHDLQLLEQHFADLTNLWNCHIWLHIDTPPDDYTDIPMVRALEQQCDELLAKYPLLDAHFQHVSKDHYHRSDHIPPHLLKSDAFIDYLIACNPEDPA